MIVKDKRLGEIMAWYEIKIIARNCRLKRNPNGTHGFKHTLWCDADSPEQAEAMALTQMEQQIAPLLHNTPEDPPLVFVEQVRPAETVGEPTQPAFFPEQSVPLDLFGDEDWS